MLNKNVKDETGKRYGILLVIECANHTVGNGNMTWVCKCDCGEVTLASGNSLRTGHTTSCGCQRGSPLPHGEGSFNELYGRYKARAENNNRCFELTKEEFSKLTKQECVYCGKLPEQGNSDYRYRNGSYIYNGIDRVDSSKGYTLENCVACCGQCNKALNYSKKDFLEWVERVYSYSIKKTLTK